MNTNTIDSREVLILSLSKFCRDAGISPVTAWRWRKRGLLHTVNIYGRQYLTRASIDEFVRRAEAGELATRIIAPHLRRGEHR